jgi:hypothetical protein
MGRPHSQQAESCWPTVMMEHGSEQTLESDGLQFANTTNDDELQTLSMGNSLPAEPK